MYRVLFLSIFVLFMAGCATSHTSLRTDKGLQIYQVSEEFIFRVVYEEMYKIADDDEFVEAIDGPDKGYSITFYKNSLRVSRYIIYARIIPASGVDAEGKVVSGYYLNFKGDGWVTYPTARPKKLIKAIEARMSKEGNAMVITDMKRGTYDKKDTRENTSIVRGNIQDRLRTLQSLLKERVINQEDYEQKKADLLKEL